MSKVVSVRNEDFSEATIGRAFARAYRKLKRTINSKDKPGSITLMVGAPGAGKSTFAESYDNPNTVVFDACSTTKGARTAILNMAKKAGIRANAVLVRTGIDKCLERNAERDEDRMVPEDAVKRAHGRLPTEKQLKGEGFSRVRVI